MVKHTTVFFHGKRGAQTYASDANPPVCKCYDCSRHSSHPRHVTPTGPGVYRQGCVHQFQCCAATFCRSVLPTGLVCDSRKRLLVYQVQNVKRRPARYLISMYRSTRNAQHALQILLFLLKDPKALLVSRCFPFRVGQEAMIMMESYPTWQSPCTWLLDDP